MNAKEFLLTDPKIEEAVSNGYDIRLEEHEWIEKMELYALTKQNSHKHAIGGPVSHVGGGEQLGNKAGEKGVSGGLDKEGYFLTGCPYCGSEECQSDHK